MLFYVYGMRLHLPIAAPGGRREPTAIFSPVPVRIDPVYGCHVWTGKRDRDGYGRLPSGELAHRAAWIDVHGAIADGLEVEHRCRNRACVRHLELLTRSQQERAKRWRSRTKTAKCNAGHDMGLHSYVTPQGGRLCRICDK
jgi:hypothetical protein